MTTVGSPDRTPPAFVEAWRERSKRARHSAYFLRDRTLHNNIPRTQVATKVGAEDIEVSVTSPSTALLISPFKRNCAVIRLLTSSKSRDELPSPSMDFSWRSCDEVAWLHFSSDGECEYHLDTKSPSLYSAQRLETAMTRRSGFWTKTAYR